MNEINCNVAIIGGGPAGLAAAVSARKEGAGRVLIIERDKALGGILQQCIHPGFGLKYYNEELTGPEYAGRFVAEAAKLGVETLLDSMVLSVTPDKKVICVNSSQGVVTVNAGAVVLAMGCRERTRGNISIPGMRPAGIYTAGSAQRLINIQGCMVGRRAVILGSGDIGMIMARRLTLEGVKVEAVVELLPYLAGLTRNRVQCLEDFGIPLLLSHTITDIKGLNRVEGVTVSAVDEKGVPIDGTQQEFACDTLLLSVGLIPENELSSKAGIKMDAVTRGPQVDQHMQTSAEGIFACGNVVHVNDLVDNVSKESEKAGKFAAQYASGSSKPPLRVIETLPGQNIRYICPQKIALSEKAEAVTLYFRVKAPCRDARIKISSGGEKILSRKAKVLNPGEMESAVINAEMLQKAAGDILVEAVGEDCI